MEPPGRYDPVMETIVQFLRRGDQFMARGQVHTVKHPHRDGPAEKVLIIGERGDGQYFEAEFDFGETVDTLTATM